MQKIDGAGKTKEQVITDAMKTDEVVKTAMDLEKMTKGRTDL